MASSEAMVDFTAHTIDGLRAIAEDANKKAHDKKEELRQYVGLRYRDLLLSADAIIHMEKQCIAASGQTKTLKQTLSSLGKGRGSKYLKTTKDLKNIAEEKSLIQQVSATCQASDRLWQHIEAGELRKACKLYYRTKVNYFLLYRSAEDKILMGLSTSEQEKDGGDQNKKLLLLAIQHWHCLQRFPRYIKERCDKTIMGICPTLNSVHDSLGALALISGDNYVDSKKVQSFSVSSKLNTISIAERMLELRLDTVKGILHSAEEVGKCSGDVDELFEFACEVVRDFTLAVTCTLHYCASIFLRSHPSGLDSSYCPDKANEIVEHIPLPNPEKVRSLIQKWIREVKSLVDTSLPKIIAFIKSGKQLKVVQEVILEILDPLKEPTLEGYSWENAVTDLFPTRPSEEGKGVETPVKGNESSVVWDFVFADIFCKKNKEIISTKFKALKLVSSVQLGVLSGFRGTVVDGNKENHIDSNAGPIVWQQLSAWVKHISGEFQNSLRAILADLDTMLRVDHVRILSITKLIRFVLKLDVQKASTKAVTDVVSTLRKELYELESAALGMTKQNYMKSVDKAIFLAMVSRTIAEIDTSSEKTESDFVGQMLDAAYTAGRHSLLATSYSGFRIWSRRLGSTLAESIATDFCTFVDDAKLSLRLESTWTVSQNAKDLNVKVPCCPSAYILRPLLFACDKMYQICGPVMDSGVLMCLKLDVCTMSIKTINSILDTILENHLKAPTWKQILLDIRFFFSVLKLPDVYSMPSSPLKFSESFVAKESKEECKQVRKEKEELISRIESKLDQVELGSIQKQLEEGINRYIQQSHVLFGALGVTKRTIGEGREEIPTTPKTPKTPKTGADSIVRVIPLAAPIDHISMLPTSLYPKKSVRQNGGVTTKVGTLARRDGSPKFNGLSNVETKRHGLLDLVIGRIFDGSSST